MSKHSNEQTVGGFELQNFEKNRYFQGKLMTARDMRVEQEYHDTRLRTLNKLTTGVGIVSGLTISDLQDHGDALRVTIEPGVAIDYDGRPIVVKNRTTKRLTAPDGDEIYLYLEYDEQSKDPVPVPGAEGTGGENAEESRILEVLEISYKETPPEEYKTIPSVEFPEFERHGEADPVEAAHKVINEYHQAVRSEIESRTDPSIFIGSFKRTPDGEWKPGEETQNRPFVYDNDMLYATLISHIVDTDNPHRTTVGEPTDYVESELDQIEGFAIRLEAIRSEFDELSETLQMHTEYATHKSLKSASRFFDSVADTLGEDPQTSRRALEIVDALQDAIIEDVYLDESTYFDFVRSLTTRIDDLGKSLEGTVTQRSYAEYREKADELETAVSGDPTVLEVTVALDKLGEAADLLEQRYEIVSE